MVGNTGTLSVNADIAELKNLVVEWLELLVQEKYAEALEFILYDNTQVVDGTLWTWTPQIWRRMFLHMVCLGSQRKK